jgi:hypothetical protein
MRALSPNSIQFSKNRRVRTFAPCRAAWDASDVEWAGLEILEGAQAFD